MFNSKTEILLQASPKINQAVETRKTDGLTPKVNCLEFYYGRNHSRNNERNDCELHHVKLN